MLYGQRVIHVVLATNRFLEQAAFRSFGCRPVFLCLSMILIGIGRDHRLCPVSFFVTIDKNGGEITTMVNMDESFEKRLQKSPKKIKYDCNGAYFEE